MRSARSLATATLATTAEDTDHERAAALSPIAGVLDGLLAELARLREAAATASVAERGARVSARGVAGPGAPLALVPGRAAREADGLLDQGEVERFDPLPPSLAAG